jgi:hypothetical protein
MPIKFAIYNDGQLVEDFDAALAVPVGPEGVPVAGRVRFDGDLLVIEGDEEPPQPIGVMLPWDLGLGGCYTLETTRLPPREEPYNLNVELLRHRMMKLLQKQEDWVLFDLQRAGPEWVDTMSGLKKALAEALTLLPDGPAAATVADEALADAIDLSEELARLHGEVLLNRRRNLVNMPRNLVGCGAQPNVRNGRYRDTLADGFDFVHLAMTWRDLIGGGEIGDEPDWSDADSAVSHFHGRGTPLGAGPLIDFSEGNLPDGLALFEDDPDAVQAHAVQLVKQATTRYRGKIGLWEVVGGLHLPSPLPADFERLVELTHALVSAAKRVVQDQAKVLVQIREPFGGYLGRGQGVPPLLYAELIAQSGIAIDGFSIELNQGEAKPGRGVRDLLQISALLDRFAGIGKPVYLTCVGSPGRDAGVGRWKRAWDAKLQGEWAERMFRLAISKPNVECVAWPELGDEQADLPDGGLLDDMLRPKPALETLSKLRRDLHANRR